MSSRLASLPIVTLVGVEVHVAIGFRARALGLSYLDLADAGTGLLIPRCPCVHTFGMRFALDLIFLAPDGAPCSVRHKVPPRRVAWDRRAAAVIELPESSRFAIPGVAPGGELS
jgi:uncharacterized protein